jgi:hypothetical protein
LPGPKLPVLLTMSHMPNGVHGDDIYEHRQSLQPRDTTRRSYKREGCCDDFIALIDAEVDNLEEELSHLVECDFSIGCASGSDALLLTLMVAVEHILDGLAHVIANGRELSTDQEMETASHEPLLA